MTHDFLIVLAVLAIGGGTLWAITAWHLRGEDLAAFDQPTGERFSTGPQPSAELGAVIASLRNVQQSLRGVPLYARNELLRRAMDGMFAERRLDATFTPVVASGVPGEWVCAPGADPDRRTLYIHGGAFTAGSPKSHRTLTARFSELTGGAVLSVDYRLMPEHPRRAGIDDCRAAYLWMFANGPAGPAPARTVFVAGDSAGGNLTLSVTAWARDQGLRVPDAAVALSPLTDATLASPSLRAHRRSDPMLGPIFGKLAGLPPALALWMSWLLMRINPRDPVVSPARGDLSRLPPVLVQVSAIEMLHDDARRYVNRARAAGSPVRLQTWEHMVHVWQIFNPELTEARDALAEVGKFLDAAAPARSALEAA